MENIGSSFETFYEQMNKENNSIGEKLRSHLLEDEKKKFRDQKQNFKWFKKTMKRFNRLIKSNPSTIYIFEDKIPIATGTDYVDVNIALPNFFGKLQSRWVCTLLTKAAYEADMEIVKSSKGEFFTLDKLSNIDKFDDMYFDIPGFYSEEDVIKYFKEWLKIFFPELLGKEIKFEVKE